MNKLKYVVIMLVLVGVLVGLQLSLGLSRLGDSDNG